MPDVPYKPEEQVLKRIEEQQRAEMRRELERKVVEAKPASGSAAFKPELASENEKLKLAVADRSFEPAVEAESKVLQASERLRAGEQRVSQVNSTEVVAWRPDAHDKRVIASRVERWPTGRETEGQGVEATVRFLEKTGNYTAFIEVGGPGKPDVLCLCKDGKLTTVECKGSEKSPCIDGRLDGKGKTNGLLASDAGDGTMFQNDPDWLERCKDGTREAIERKINDPNLRPVDKADYEKLLKAYNRAARDFSDQAGYHRIVGVAAPEIRIGNIRTYLEKVKPNKIVKAYV